MLSSGFVFLSSTTAFLLLVLPCILAQSEHKQRAAVGILVDLHQSVGHKANKTKTSTRVPCDSLNVHAFQQLAAVKWAADTINNKSWPEEFALDIVVRDTCGESEIALTETHELLNWARGNLQTPLIGVIVIGSRNNERIIDLPLESLNKDNISAIVTSARAAELLLSSHPNVFTTAPDISSVTEAIISLINQLSSTSVAVISSCSHAIKRFENFATAKSIRVKHYLVLEKDNPRISDVIIKFLRGEAESVQSVVLLLEASELERLVNDGDSTSTEQLYQLTQEKSWILGTVGMDQELAREWSTKFHSNLLVMQPHVAPNPDFKARFLQSVKDSLTHASNAETREYVQRIHHCQWQKKRSSGRSSSSPPCANLSASSLEQKFRSESDVGFIMSAMSAYSAALRLAQLETCQNETECDHTKLSTAVIDALRKLNFPIMNGQSVSSDATESTVAASHELEGTRGRINHQGKLVSRKYDLFLSKPSGQISQVGQYSHEDGLVLDVMLGINLEGDTNMQDRSGWARPLGKERSGLRRGKTAKPGSKEGQEFPRQHYLQGGDSVNVRKMSPPEFYISRVWAMAVTAVGITGVFISLYMLVYVLQRMCDGTLQGNQVLGILLLLAIMMMYASVVLFVLPPGDLLCNLRVFVPSIASTLCFGLLLIKIMQLRAFVSLGLGGRVSAMNQFVTLIFIVAVQVAVNIQWFFSPHPEKIDNDDLFNECFYSHENYLYLHVYLGLLILFVFLYGTSVLKIRRNYNEGKWVTLASFLSLPIAAAWAIVVHTSPSYFQEPAACIAFIATATVVLFSVYVPKLSTINQQSELAKRKKMLQQVPPGYTGSISTIFTSLSDRGTLQSQVSQKRNSYQSGPQSSSSHSHYIPPPPPMPSSGKSVTYSPRLTTNFFQSSSAATSLARSVSMKTPFFDSHRAAYP